MTRKNQVFDGKGNVIFEEESPYTSAELHGLNYLLRSKKIGEGPTVGFGNGRVINPPIDPWTIGFFGKMRLKAEAAQDKTAMIIPGYRARNGIFDLSAAEVIALDNEGEKVIAAAFRIYNANEAAINAGTMTTVAQVEAAYE